MSGYLMRAAKGGWHPANPAHSSCLGIWTISDAITPVESETHYSPPTVAKGRTCPHPWTPRGEKGTGNGIGNRLGTEWAKHRGKPCNTVAVNH